MALQTPATGSIINNASGSDLTSLALSTSIIISVNGTPVGAIQTISFDQEREITMVSEVGTDGVVDSAPTRSTMITGTCRRIRFNGTMLTEAFSRDYRNIAAQRIPFDILIIDQNNGASDTATILTHVQNVWFSRLNFTFDQSNWLITDEVSFKAETMFSTLNSGASAASSGIRGFNLQNNADEQNTDIGKNRGALSAPGLLTAVFT